jgi:outer membrane protein
MKTSFLTLSMASLATLFSVAGGQQAPPAQRTSNVAFVSSQRILAETTEGKAELARAQTMQQQKAADIRARQQTLAATHEQLLQAPDPAAREKLQQLEQQQRLDLERAAAQAQVDIQTLQRAISAEFQRRVKSVIEELVKDRDVQLVVNADAALVWGASGLDLTSAVVQKLNDTAPPILPKP